MEAIKGLGVALVTPFKADLSVDHEALVRIVNYCIDGGVDYLVALGTTGESATLNKDEKHGVVQTIISANADRVPLVIGIGGNNTSAVAEALCATDLEPFAAVLSVSPYYNKPAQEGIFRHYRVLAENCAKPLIIYNVPSRTGSNVLPETAIRLAREVPNIIAVKEASGDPDQIKTLIGKAPEGFMVLSGDDATARETVLLGGHGVISVLGQGLPQQCHAMLHNALNGHRREAAELDLKLARGIELIFREGNPTGIKALLSILGLCGDTVRLPLVAASDSLKQEIEDYTAEMRHV